VPANSTHYRQFARQALLAKVNSVTATHTDIAAAFQVLRTCLARTLVPIFGSVATDALFTRSAHLLIDEFAWLSDVLSFAPRLNDINASGIPAKPADDVIDGFAAILACDIALLATLVGEDVILPLVRKAWDVTGPSAAA
jgi:hypothetical protein